MAARITPIASSPAVQPDWPQVVRLLHTSRALDDIEQMRLLPERKVHYQSCARGHDLAQILLGLQLTDPHDGERGAIVRVPCCSPWGQPLRSWLQDAGPRRLVQRRARYRGGVQSSRPWRPSVLPAVGGVGAVHLCGRVGAGDPLPA
jgi:2-oxoisovalerate dehydrogenase E1 component